MIKKKEERQEEVFIDSISNGEGEGYKKKVVFFQSQKDLIHVRLKNGKWFNGEIVLIENDLFIIKDFKRGEVPILFEEIDHIEKYKVREVT